MNILSRFFCGSTPSNFPRVRTNDPDTSHAAAAQATDLAIDHQSLIMFALDKPGTIYDIAERTGLDVNQVARRMGELESLHLVRTEGKAKGGTGRLCRVWHGVSIAKDIMSVAESMQISFESAAKIVVDLYIDDLRLRKTIDE